MKKEKNPSFILTLDLKPEIYQVHILEKRFNIARQIYNACLAELLKRYQKMKSDVRYIKNIQLPKSTERNQVFRELNREYDLSEYDLHSFVKSMCHHFSKHIDSHTGQKMATRAWNAFKKYMYKQAKQVHFKKFGTMDSVEGKTNKSGIRYINETLRWNGMIIPVQMDQNDEYARMALTQKIKFCRIQRKFVRGKVKYYIQLIIDGIPPAKIDHKTGTFKRISPSGEVGLDIGISTLAIVSDNQVDLVELADDLADIQKEKRRIQRKMDRSRRATNPNKYHEEGTIKKNHKGKWVRSQHYLQSLYRLKELDRKLADKRKLSHEILSNRVLRMGGTIKVEKMNYKALQKTRYGKRIGLKAPSMFLSILDRKLKYINKELMKINTWKVKASQYDPLSNTYKKKPLSERWHVMDNGIRIQRDIFSAWIIKHVKDNLWEVDRPRCIQGFDSFYQKYERVIKDIKETCMSSLKR